MATSTPSIQALVSFPSILLMIFFTFFLYTWCNDNAYTHSLMASPISYHWSQRLSRITHVFKQPPHLSRMVLCQFLLCVFLSFSSCVCSGTLFLSPSTCAHANTVYNVHTLFLSLGTHACANTVYSVHTLSLSLSTHTCANTVYSVHTHTLSLSTHTCAFTQYLHSCKHCLQCAHTLPFTRHSHSCKHCLQTICSMYEKPGLEPELSLSLPALRAPAWPMV